MPPTRTAQKPHTPQVRGQNILCEGQRAESAPGLAQLQLLDLTECDLWRVPPMLQASRVLSIDWLACPTLRPPLLLPVLLYCMHNTCRCNPLRTQSFTALRTLLLGGNALHADQFPATLSALGDLVELDLSKNRALGPVPDVSGSCVTTRVSQQRIGEGCCSLCGFAAAG